MLRAARPSAALFVGLLVVLASAGASGPWRGAGRPVSAGLAAALATASPDLVAPPWGIEAVTTADLTPERFKEALPAQFGGYYLVTDLDPIIVRTPIYPFAEASETVRYYGAPRPVDVPVAGVNVTTLPADLEPVEALEAIRREGPNQPVFEVVDENLDPEAAVPYLLVKQYGGAASSTVPALIWGSRDGRWLFTVTALEEDDLAALVGLVVANLERQGDAATPPAATPPAGRGGA